MVDVDAASVSAERLEYRKAVDRLVILFALVSILTTIGIYFGLGMLIFFLIPATLALLLLIPCVRSDGKHTRGSRLVGGFSVVMLAIMIAVLIAESSSATLVGLPLGSALFLLVLWPYTVIGGGVLYAYVYQGWLRRVDVGPEKSTSRS